MSDYLLILLSETSSLRCSKHSVLRKVQTCNALISLGISRVSLACFAIRNDCETADAMNDKMVDYRVPVSSILTKVPFSNTPFISCCLRLFRTSLVRLTRDWN